jgi:hypothetical protein
MNRFPYREFFFGAVAPESELDMQVSKGFKKFGKENAMKKVGTCIVAALFCMLLMGRAAQASTYSYTDAGTFSTTGTSSLPLGSGWSLAFTANPQSGIASGTQTNWGTFALTGSSGTGTVPSPETFTLVITQTVAGNPAASSTASVTGSVSVGASNVVVLTFAPNPIQIIIPGQTFTYSIATSSDPTINGGAPYAVAVAADGTPSSLNGTFTESANFTPLPSSAMGGAALCLLLAASRFRKVSILK